MYTKNWYFKNLIYQGIDVASKNTSFSLGEHFSHFVETQVDEGRYSNVSDVVRAGLRLLEEREAKLAALRAALIEGEQSGPPTSFDFNAFVARKRAAKTPVK